MICKVIADVAFLLSHRTDFIIDEANPIAEAFYLPVNKIKSTDHQIHFQLCTDPMPFFKHESLLFCANNGWNTYKDEQFYWIVLHPPEDEEPIWGLRMDHRFSKGMVYSRADLAPNHNDSSIPFDPVAYPLDQILMMHFLALHQGMLVHAAGWRVHAAGWMFAGKSGAGKSTISNLIVEHTETEFLSDDRMIVRKIKDDFLMYGTPWPGDAGYAVNESAPLKGIFFLSKGEKNFIRKLGGSDAISRLMPVVSIPWYDSEKVELMMDFCDALISAVPMYELTFVPDKSAVDMLVKFVDG